MLGIKHLSAGENSNPQTEEEWRKKTCACMPIIPRHERQRSMDNDTETNVECLVSSILGWGVYQSTISQT